MTTNELLKTSGPINFEILSISPVREFDKRDGGTYEAHEVELRVPASGEQIKERMFPKFVQYLKVGGSVRGEAGPKYPNWGYVQSGQQFETNSQAVKNERTFTEESKKPDKSVISRIVCSYMGAAIGAGKSPADAKTLAKEAYYEQVELVEEIYQSELNS